MKEDAERISRRTKRTLTVVVIAVAVIIATSSTNAFFKNRPNPRLNESVIASALPGHQTQRQDRVETELITLQQTGFEPNEIRRPRGAFILGVDNRSGIEAIELRLVRADGQPLNALVNARRKTSWRDVVDLAPGQYVLSEANHSDWTCQITILPR